MYVHALKSDNLIFIQLAGFYNILENILYCSAKQNIIDFSGKISSRCFIQLRNG